jgi:ribonuclease R
MANETVAKFGSKLHKGKRAMPFVYRIHDKPNPEKLEMFSAVASRFGYNIRFDDPAQAAEIFNTLLKQDRRQAGTKCFRNFSYPQHGKG